MTTSGMTRILAANDADVTRRFLIMGLVSFDFDQAADEPIRMFCRMLLETYNNPAFTIAAGMYPYVPDMMGVRRFRRLLYATALETPSGVQMLNNLNAYTLPARMQWIALEDDSVWNLATRLFGADQRLLNFIEDLLEAGVLFHMDNTSVQYIMLELDELRLPSKSEYRVLDKIASALRQHGLETGVSLF